MYTNKTRITGLSGLDTESLVKQLMQAESVKYNKLYQKRQLMEWKQQAYQSVSSNLLNFQSSFLSFTSNTANNLRSVANFKGFTSTVKVGGVESNAITVKTTSTTAGGSYTLKVNQVAKADTYKSTAAINSSITGSGAVNWSDIKEGDSIKVSLDGATAKEIVFDSSYFTAGGTIDTAAFDSKLQAKLDQLFGKDGANSKVTVDTTSTGALVIKAGSGHTATVSNGNRVDTSYTGDTYNGLDLSGGDITGTSFTITVGGVTRTIDLGTISSDLTGAQLTSQINTKIAAEFKDSGVSGVSVSFKDGKFVISNPNGSDKASITDDDGFLSTIGIGNGTDPIKLNNSSSLAAFGVKSGQNTNFDTNQKIGDLITDGSIIGTDNKIRLTINDKLFTFDSDTSVKDVMNTINSANIGVKISFNSTRSEFTMEATSTGQANAIKLDAGFENGLLGQIFGLSADPSSHVAEASDAIFELNGLATSRETNDFTIEGLTISLTAAAEGQTFDISLTKDTTETMNLIKNFVSEYNKLIEAINKQLTTSRPKSGNYTYYEPLTKDEKSALSEREIEEWEQQAKTGMLYRDETLNTLKTQLRSMLYQSVEMSDGTKLSLYQLGITTSSKLSEAGYLQIDEDKLQKALSEMPDKVAEFFTKSSDISASDKKNRNQRLATEGFAERINDIINWTAGSGGTLYNKAGLAGLTIDSEMSKKIKEQDDKISEMLKYLAKRETYYYNMFSKLETAMTQADSQMAALQSMLGIS